MTDGPGPCDATRALAAELALGVAEGADRGEALAHLAGCADCQAEVRRLTDAVDAVVALAPEAEPPAGFESSVLSRLGQERTADRRRPWVLGAAAAVLLTVGVAVGLLAARGDEGSTSLATARMAAPDGEVVGEVWRTGEADAAVFVSVPAWAQVEDSGTGAPRYTLRLELADGETIEVGDFGLGDGSSSWAVPTELDGDDIRAVSVVDDSGRVWCTGRFA